MKASKRKEANSNDDEDNMARDGKDMTRKGKRDTGKKIVEGVRGPNREQRKRGRKIGREHMKTLIDAYMAGNPPEVKAQIASWERELNDNTRNQDIPMEE